MIFQRSKKLFYSFNVSRLIFSSTFLMMFVNPNKAVCWVLFSLLGQCEALGQPVVQTVNSSRGTTCNRYHTSSRVPHSAITTFIWVTSKVALSNYLLVFFLNIFSSLSCLQSVMCLGPSIITTEVRRFWFDWRNHSTPLWFLFL